MIAYDFGTRKQIGPTFKMAPNQYSGQSIMADIAKTFNISYIKQNRSTGQYIHTYQGENTDKI